MSNQNNHTDIQNHTSSYRKDIVDTLGGAITIALQKEYDRGWSECMKYFWNKQEEENNKIFEDGRC